MQRENVTLALVMTTVVLLTSYKLVMHMSREPFRDTAQPLAGTAQPLAGTAQPAAVIQAGKLALRCDPTAPGAELSPDSDRDPDPNTAAIWARLESGLWYPHRVGELLPPELTSALLERHRGNQFVLHPELLGLASWVAPFLPRYLATVETMDAVLKSGCQSGHEHGNCPPPRSKCSLGKDAKAAQLNGHGGGPWGRCPNFTSLSAVRPAECCCKRQYDLVMLTTFPNSGTSWTKGMFSAATGYSAEAVFKEGPNSEHHGCGIIGYGASPPRNRNGSNPAFVKTHTAAGGCLTVAGVRECNIDRAIVLRRDPIDNVFSRLRFEGKIVKPQRLSEYTAGQKHKLYSDATGELRSYVQWHCKTQRGYDGLPTLVIRYEQFLDSPLTTLTSMLDFIGYSPSRREILEAVLKVKGTQAATQLRFPGIPESITGTRITAVLRPEMFEMLLDCLEKLVAALALNTEVACTSLSSANFNTTTQCVLPFANKTRSE